MTTIYEYHKQASHSTCCSMIVFGGGSCLKLEGKAVYEGGAEPCVKHPDSCTAAIGSLIAR